MTLNIDGMPSLDLSALASRFPNAYPLHFGSSARSKFYPQAMQLAKLALWQDVHGSVSSRWHTVVVSQDDLDLLALLYHFASKLPNPKVLGADVLSVSLGCRNGGEYRYAHASKAKLKRVTQACKTLTVELGMDYKSAGQYLDQRVLRPVQRDMLRAREKLQQEGFLDRLDPNSLALVKAKRKPREAHLAIQSIRDSIKAADYRSAVEGYYRFLGDEPFGELTPELLYLKRLGGIELDGRDVLYFLPPASRSPLVRECLQEFVLCLDEAIQSLSIRNERLVAILQREAPTMDALVAEQQDAVERAVWLEDGKLERDTSTAITPEFFGQKYGMCPDGRLFEKYPDQVAFCNRFETEEDPKYHGFWITYDEAYIREHVLSRRLRLRLIDAYRHKDWTWRGKRGTREPAFQTARSLSEIEKSAYGLDHLRYTGRSHRIEGKRFHEADLVRYVRGESLGNPFLDAIHDVLREAENALRERHGLPRIGEGWVSEMRLYELVHHIFPDAEHHVTPEWLKPQHLDIYVPTKSLALEYQGEQHFKPIEFFGGEDAYVQLGKRDARKARKCKANGVLLIAWRHDWALTVDMLKEVLQRAGISGQDRQQGAA